MRRYRDLAAITVVLVVVLSALAPALQAEATSAPPCSGVPVIVLHDIARDTSSVAGLADQVRAQGRCVHVISYGAPRLARQASVPVPIGGMEDIDATVRELSPGFAQLGGPGRTADVVAVGAGSLVAMRYLQIAVHPIAIRKLIGIGTLWHGTNLVGLADLEQSSRDAGTYDTVLPLEQVALDGLCASCRELLTGSDFMRAFWRAGLAPRGTSVTSIISAHDGLVAPYTSGALAGTRTVTLQHLDPSDISTHFQLPTDPLVIRLVLQVLGGVSRP